MLRIVADWAEPERRNLSLIGAERHQLHRAGRRHAHRRRLPPRSTTQDQVEGRSRRPSTSSRRRTCRSTPPTCQKPDQAGGAVVVRISLQPDHAVTGGLYSGPVFADGTEVKTGPGARRRRRPEGLSRVRWTTPASSAGSPTSSTTRPRRPRPATGATSVPERRRPRPAPGAPRGPPAPRRGRRRHGDRRRATPADRDVLRRRRLDPMDPARRSRDRARRPAGLPAGPRRGDHPQRRPHRHLAGRWRPHVLRPPASARGRRLASGPRRPRPRRGLAVVAEDARREHGVELAIRVAVHTGLVVRAEMGTSSAPDHDAIVGETPAVAARLQEKARPGTVLVSDATHALVEGRFSVVPVGPFQLRGVNRPDRGLRGPGRRADPPRRRRCWPIGASPSWAAAPSSPACERCGSRCGAAGHVAALIRGDSGIGKTRLAAELRRHVLDAGGRALTTSCSSYLGSTPLHPVRRLVEAAAGIGPATSPDDVRTRLAGSLDRFGRLDALPVIADLLGVEAVAGGGPPELDPARLATRPSRCSSSGSRPRPTARPSSSCWTTSSGPTRRPSSSSPGSSAGEQRGCSCC